MTRTEHLLFILAEEAAEVAQRASKAARFGLAEVQPGQELTNAQRLMQEVNDFVAVCTMIAGPVVSPTSSLFKDDPLKWTSAIGEKQAKIEKFLLYSAECGTLEK